MNLTEPMSTRVRQASHLAIMKYIVFGCLILYFGSTVFIPLAYAALISFVLYPFCSWMEKKGIGRMLAIGLSIGLLTVLISLVVVILVKQMSDFGSEWNVLQPRLDAALSSFKQYLSESVGFSNDSLMRLPEDLFGSALGILEGAILKSASTLVMLILIPVYVVLILYYRQLWKVLICRLFPGQTQESITNLLYQTVNTYYNFIKGMAIVYLLVGILNSVGLLALGVPHAFLFGFIASILTFIPYIGIITGALLPVTVAWITHDSIWYPLGVVAVFMFVQYLEANVIFPFAVSSRLKVNTMAVLLSIFIGGILWGVSGMILFVPLVGIVKLIADSNPEWETVSLALGTDVKKTETIL